MVLAPLEFNMNFKTFLFLFILGFFVSCSSNKVDDTKKDPTIPDHYGRSK